MIHRFLANPFKQRMGGSDVPTIHYQVLQVTRSRNRRCQPILEKHEAS